MVTRKDIQRKMLQPGDFVKIRGTKGWILVIHAFGTVLIGEGHKKEIMFFTQSEIIESYSGES